MLHTAVGYWRSKEGEEEYRKLGLDYNNHCTVYDMTYSTEFLGNNRKSKDPEDHTWYQNVIRVQSSFNLNNDSKSGKQQQQSQKKEYLIHDITETRIDPAGNKKRWYKSKIGIYPIPQVSWKLVRNPETGIVEYDEEANPKRVIDRIINVKKGYSIPFTKATLQRMADEGYIVNEDQRVTHFMVQKDNERHKIMVKSLDDLMNLKFEDLYGDGGLRTFAANPITGVQAQPTTI
ncbi:MAG: hypothetical protein ACRD8W_05635 [Nitrososphaeraceae archaeon]